VGPINSLLRRVISTTPLSRFQFKSPSWGAGLALMQAVLLHFMSIIALFHMHFCYISPSLQRHSIIIIASLATTPTPKTNLVESGGYD
jgi:hypothetical protein